MYCSKFRSFVFAAATVVAQTAVLAAQPNSTDWPCWRGPNADGVADGRNLPIRWSQTENIRWSVKLPGWGTSSPVVYGDRVFVTSEVKEDGKKSLLTLCFDRTDGRELWRHDFGLGVNQKSHEKSTLAVNTPAVTKDAVYVAFGNSDIAGYSHTGKLMWVNRYMSRFGDPKMSWGYGLSPLVLEDGVLFPWDHHKGPCFLIGLDPQTGEIAWQEDRPIGTAHATPLLVKHHGQIDILVPGKHRLTAFDAKTHIKLWQYGEGEGPFNGEIIVSPVHGDGMVFLQLWRQSQIHAIRLTGKSQPPEPLWISEKPGPVESSLLYYRGLLYALMDNGVLICFDGKTGEEKYRERLGGSCNSSPIASDGRIYLSNNDGTTFVIQAGPTFNLVATNQLGERITASPAITGDELIYRTDSHLYCIGQSRADTTATPAPRPTGPLPNGTGRFEFDLDGLPLEVFTYKPPNYTGRRMIMVMHGVLRNADEYRDHALAMGERFDALIVAPRFDSTRFPTRKYQMGGILNPDNSPTPASEWTYNLIPKLARAVRAVEKQPDMPYWIIGHSAGGQFIVRMAAFADTGAERLVAANPGSHLFPTRDLPFGYGFARLPEQLSDDATLQRYLAAPLTIFLGTADNKPDSNFDRSENAMKQGEGRWQRGRACFQLAQELAAKNGWTFNWRLVEAGEIAHDHEQMFNHEQCAVALFGKADATGARP